VSNSENQFTYDADGLKTLHYAPFVQDRLFRDAYAKAIAPLDPETADVRYRAYVIQWAVSQVRDVAGDFVEFGTYNAKAATFILSLEDLRSRNRKFLLFDTFAGIPHKHLTENEIRNDFAGMYSDVSIGEVKEKLRDYLDIVEFHAGVVPESLEGLSHGPVAFIHMDINAAKPTRAALELFYPFLQPGGVIVFDDYGWKGYEDQRYEVDDFFSDKEERIFALPTGQGIIVKKCRMQPLSGKAF
jgi:O-methyltransferase